MSALPRDDSNDTGGHAAWQRVSKARPCRICKGPKGCMIAPNGDVVCLRRESDELVRYLGPTAWWHRTDAPIPVTLRHTPAPATPAPHTASTDTRARVNRRLLELCPPSAGDRAYVASLHERTDLSALYGTLPRTQDQRPLIATLVDEFGHDTLMTVPGFIVRDGHLRLNGAGLLIAIDDIEGHLVGFQVRYGPGDYRWLSTSNGPSTGAPSHIARPLTLRDQRIYIVESPKTANILADRLGAVVIATAGHGNWKVARAALEHLIARAGAEVVVIALDADDPDAKATTVAQVEHSRQQLAALAHSLGYHVKIGRWAHADGKGPDDLLINGHTFRSEVYTPPADESGCGRGQGHGLLGGLAVRTSDENLVSVEPRFLAWLITQTAATAELRARYHYVLAVTRDRALNDGQKLTEIALFARLPLRRSETPAEPVEPVTVAAATIARDLGSEVTRQKDGSLRPTKLGTVTKNLGDLINLGVRTRDSVVTERIITIPNKRDKKGPPIEQTITTTSYAYYGSGSLPGQRMERDEARAKAAGARKDRERTRRCPSCYSDKLKPSAHVCLKCGRESSDVEATRAGQEIVDLGDGRFRHRDTDEIIVPGVAVVPATEFETQYRNPILAPDEVGTIDENPDEAGSVDEDADGAQYRNPVTIDRSEQGYRNPVSGPVEQPRLLIDLPLPPIATPSNRMNHGMATPATVPVDRPQANHNDEAPTERCRTCGAAHYRWSARWREWVCATCYPPLVKGAAIKDVPARDAPGALHILDSSAATTAAAWEGLTDDD